MLKVSNLVENSDATAIHLMSESATEPSSTDIVDEECSSDVVNYNALSVSELKAICKEKNLKDYSKLSKAELIELLNKNKEWFLLISTEFVAHFLSVDVDDEEEKKLVENLINSAYTQLKISTNKDLRENEEFASLIDDTICAMCFFNYYANRDDTKNAEHLENYINKNIATLQMLF